MTITSRINVGECPMRSKMNPSTRSHKGWYGQIPVALVIVTSELEIRQLIHKKKEVQKNDF